VFSGIAKTGFWIAILRSSMALALVVYTFALRYIEGNNNRQRDQANVQAMDARRAVKWCASENFPERPPRMFLPLGQLHHLAETTWSRAQFHNDLPGYD
jgi:hypothetical protein